MKSNLTNILLLILVLSACIDKSTYGQPESYKIILEKKNSLIQNENLEKINTNDNLLLKSGIAIAATGLFFLVDQNIREELTVRKYQNNLLLDIGHEYGETNYNFGLAGALYLSQYFFEEKEIANTGKVLFESLIVSGVISISLKYIFGRSRPNRQEGNTKFNWFETKNTFNSLPSGHVITAFTTSTVLSNAIDNKYVSFLLYSFAGLTAYQRIASDNHWFSDVFLGASIGYIVGQYFSDLSEEEKISSGKYNLIPFFSKNISGILFQYKF